MANSGKFESFLMRIVAASWLLSLCPVMVAETAVPTQPPVQLLEAVDLRDEKAAVWLVADAVSLQALALRIEAMSGVDVVIAPGLSQAVVNVRVASPNWETALQQLFSNYSTVVAWDQQGQIRSVYVLAGAARETDLKAAPSQPTPTAGRSHSILSRVEDIATHSGSTPQTDPDYELPTDAAEVLELMTVDQGGDAAKIELLPQQQRPEIRELLQRMRTVGKPMEKTIIERQLAADSREPPGTATQTP